MVKIVEPAATDGLVIQRSIQTAIDPKRTTLPLWTSSPCIDLADAVRVLWSSHLTISQSPLHPPDRRLLASQPEPPLQPSPPSSPLVPSSLLLPRPSRTTSRIGQSETATE
jgi:hypothetical protein